MGWGGARPGSGRKKIRRGKRSSATTPAKAAAKIPAQPRQPIEGISIGAMQRLIQMSQSMAAAKRKNAFDPFTFDPQLLHPPGVAPTDPKMLMAMDTELTGWANQAVAANVFGMIAAEGLLFLGYPYLAELTQRPEYRLASEIIADDSTRKWIDFDVTGDKTEQDDAKRRAEQDPAGEAERQADPDEQRKRVQAAGKMDRVKELKDDQLRLELRDRMYATSRNDGFFGRAHLFMDFGQGIEATDSAELKTPIGDGRDAASKAKVKPQSFNAVRAIEPMWVYPTSYSATNPLSEDWYNPRVWFVMGREVHKSRMPTFIGHPVPDMLKPAYSFGGMSTSQLVKPYVDIWLNTRESIGEMIHAFSVMVLQTNMATATQPGGLENLMVKLQMFNAFRDNQGLFLVDKASEEFKNVSAPLGGLHELQAQAQEHMASVMRYPLVKFTGISPSGLNASSEGEIQVYDDTVGAYQNRFFEPNLTRIINFEQLSLWGEVDPEITHHFEPLRVMTEKEKGEMQAKDAERDQKFVDMGALAPEEIRARIIEDPDLPYADLDPDDVPDLMDEEEQGLEPQGGRPDPKAGGEPDGGGAADAVLPFGEDAESDWNESDHPRAPDGKFGSGGGSSGGKQKITAPQYGMPSGHFTASGPVAPKRTNIGEPLDVSKLSKVGAQMGSNPGGVYEGEGKKFYVKKGKSKDHVRNEMIAAALYHLAGTPTLKYRPVAGGEHVATEMAKLGKDNASKLSKTEKAEAARDFAVHAWLGNWDAVGLGGDNLGTVGGVPTALDLGGALEYRAQGAPKGKAFGKEVGELDTLRDAKTNKDAAGIFGGMTPAEMRESARFVTSIPDEKIIAAVEGMGGPKALADKLIARKTDIGEKARLFGAHGDPESPAGTLVVPAGGKLPVKGLNGVPFKPYRPPADWAAVDGQVDLGEPEFDPKGKQAASGVVIREADGRVWIVQPTGGYGGYEGTFPKGRMEKGLSMQANAIKEAYEESGLKVRITGHAGDHEGDVTTTRYYFAEREGGDPSQHDGETEGVVLAPQDRAGDFLNRKRDRGVLGMDEAPFEESKHPRDSDGKFSSSGGGGGSSSEGGVFKSKKEHAAHLLTKGTTTKEILEALKWPSISMPQMAKTLGMKLEKFKEGGVTKYKGTPMTEAEKAEAKKAQAAKTVEPKETPFSAFQKTPNFETYTKAFEAALAAGEADVAAGLAKYNPTLAAQYGSMKSNSEFAQKLIKEAEAPKKPVFPAPTAAEMEKAKKSIKLQLGYVPGAGELQFDKTKAQAQLFVDHFNKKYEGKTLTDPKALAEKVNDFKTLTNSVAIIKTAEAAHASTLAAEQKAAAQKQAAQKKVLEEAAAKASAEANKHVMAELGITEQEAYGFTALAKMMGGDSKNLVANFKKHEAELANLGYPISGFQCALIKNYSNGGYVSVNEALRKGSITQAQHVYTKMVNKALAKMPTYTGALNRGTSLTAEQQSLYVAGNVVEERAFTSSSTGGGFNGNTSFKITAIGKRGASIKKLSNHSSENEVLFQARTFFRVTKVEGSPGGSMTVHMEEMDDDGK